LLLPSAEKFRGIQMPSVGAASHEFPQTLMADVDTLSSFFFFFQDDAVGRQSFHISLVRNFHVSRKFLENALICITTQFALWRGHACYHTLMHHKTDGNHAKHIKEAYGPQHLGKSFCDETRTFSTPGVSRRSYITE
jgi:hypothetical protein